MEEKHFRREKLINSVSITANAGKADCRHVAFSTWDGFADEMKAICFHRTVSVTLTLGCATLEENCYQNYKVYLSDGTRNRKDDGYMGFYGEKDAR